MVSINQHPGRLPQPRALLTPLEEDAMANNSSLRDPLPFYRAITPLSMTAKGRGSLPLIFQRRFDIQVAENSLPG